MATPRCLLIDESVPGIYHCYSRCVRRAALFGPGLEHRRRWLRRRLLELARIFAIDVGAYSILVNHFHAILRNRPDIVATWSDVEVVRRWFKLFSVSIHRWAMERSEPGTELDDEAAIAVVSQDLERVSELRGRLSEISWLMKCLKEELARMANREDETTGHFWEGRFKSPKLGDDHAVLSCMVYVDLNVIRALEASTPEDSDYTSIQDRLAAWELFEQGLDRDTAPVELTERLYRFIDREGEGRDPEDDLVLAPVRRGDGGPDDRGMLDLTLAQYAQIVDMTGRVLHAEKPGVIPADLPPILERLGIDPGRWMEELRTFGRRAGSVLGGSTTRAKEAARRGVHHVVGHLDLSKANTT